MSGAAANLARIAALFAERAVLLFNTTTTQVVHPWPLSILNAMLAEFWRPASARGRKSSPRFPYSFSTTSASDGACVRTKYFFSYLKPYRSFITYERTQGGRS